MCGVLHDVVNLHIQNLNYICSQITVGVCLVGHHI